MRVKQGSATVLSTYDLCRKQIYLTQWKTELGMADTAGSGGRYRVPETSYNSNARAQGLHEKCELVYACGGNITREYGTNLRRSQG